MVAQSPKIAIVDYGLGNLYSIARACEFVGLSAEVSSDVAVLEKADAVLLPGVGAFADAMSALRKLDLVSALKETTLSGKPLFGICLGLQLLMSESHEFGVHEGLGLIEGTVERLPDNEPDLMHGHGRMMKVPQVGWRPIAEASPGSWSQTPLSETGFGTYQYFVHSYYVKPTDLDVVAAVSQFGETEFCAALCKDNIFACQFHPERSGPAGLAIYKNLANRLSEGGFSQ